MTFANYSRDSSAMDWYSLVASAAACSSRGQGMVSSFSGATLGLADVNHVSYLLLSVWFRRKLQRLCWMGQKRCRVLEIR